jgi:hypothetical protein
MHFEITPAMTAVRKALTPTQRTSSRFSEAPRIGAKTLRRGQKLVLKVEDLTKPVVLQLRRLFTAGAIEIHQVSDAGRRMKITDFDAAPQMTDEEREELINEHKKLLDPQDPPQDPPENQTPVTPEETPATPPTEHVAEEVPPQEQVPATEIVQPQTEVQEETASATVAEPQTTTEPEAPKKGKKAKKQE